MPGPKDGLLKKRIKYIREKRGLTQYQLASLADFHATTVSQFETGARKPSFGNLNKLAGALNISTDYLIGRTDECNANLTQEAKIFRDYESLTENDRELARDFMARLAKRNR